MVKSRFAAVIILFAALPMLSQTAPKAAVKPLPVELIKRFWQADDGQQRALRELDAAQAAKRAADETWTGVVMDLTNACGDKYELKQDLSGQDPYCGVKPEAPKK